MNDKSNGTNAQVVTLARWNVRAQSLEDVLRLVAETREKSLGEPGCLGYEVFQRVGSPVQVLLVERYRDEAALVAHRGSRHFNELVFGRIVPLLEDRQVEILHR